MAITEIITSIFKKGLIKAECAKLCKDNALCDDLAQEVTLIMLQKDDELVSGLNDRGELLFYIYRVAKNQYCSKTSPFYHKYLKYNEKSQDIDD